jgi:hypothetical protein
MPNKCRLPDYKARSWVRAIVSFIALGLSSATLAVDIEARRFSVETCRLTVPADALNASPNWQGNGTPPMTISQAGEMFHKWRSESHIEHAVISYKLISVRGPEMPSNRWVYVIEFNRFEHNAPAEPFTGKIAVLLNGEVHQEVCV